MEVVGLAAAGRGSKDSRTSLLEGILLGLGLAVAVAGRASSASEQESDLLVCDGGLVFVVVVFC